MDATEIFAHELAHVAAGEGAGLGERWDEEFQRIFDEYNRIGKERFREDGKEIETAPEYRGAWRGEWSEFVNGSSGWRDLRIIAWQPLPEPYREEQEDNGEENE